MPNELVIYTDGACAHNPGPGGYAAILKFGAHVKKLSGGRRLTTNNRMELLAILEGLRAIKGTGHTVTVVTDSMYATNPVQQGWLNRWIATGFTSQRGTIVTHIKNSDLWTDIHGLLALNKVRFLRIKGHAGHPENEECDQMAVVARQQPDLPVDEGYQLAPRAA